MTGFMKYFMVKVHHQALRLSRSSKPLRWYNQLLRLPQDLSLWFPEGKIVVVKYLLRSKCQAGTGCKCL